MSDSFSHLPPTSRLEGKKKEKKANSPFGGHDAPVNTKKMFLAPFAARRKQKKYLCYYPHRSRDSLSPVGGIFLVRLLIINSTLA